MEGHGRAETGHRRGWLYRSGRREKCEGRLTLRRFFSPPGISIVSLWKDAAMETLATVTHLEFV